jgi:allantoate deiminase
MSVTEDNVGNLIGRYAATHADARTLIIGSHLDSVRNAGRYDGVLGVLVGIAAVEALQRLGRRLHYAIEVVAFADEEGVRFGAAYSGSLALTGHPEQIDLARCDAAGVTLGQAIRDFGGGPDRIMHDARRPEDLLGYLEVHIEQGPQLEARGLPLGLVTAIAGANRVNVQFRGTAGHAGTVPMELRQDALCGAAELILLGEELARTRPGLVVTVGQISVTPGATNVIPGEATLSLDLRHQDDRVRKACLAELHTRARTIAATRQLVVSWEELLSRPAVAMDPQFSNQLRHAMLTTGVTPLELASGAGHDAAVMATTTAAAMLFVRCRGGISHHPAESVEEEDVAAAIAALSQLLEQLDRQ